ncbi:MAG: BLUF domain-containing protein [Methylococcaceae bacterium]
MFRLVYFSSATQLFSKEDLIDLLVKSKDKNSHLGITGILLYKDGNFMQILEGKGAAVLKLYEIICKDIRHKNPIVVIKTPTDERLFSDWSMGFKNLNDEDVHQIEGYHPFMNKPLTFGGLGYSEDICLDLLNTFKGF